MPELLTANTDTVPEPELVTKAKLAVGPCDMLVFIMPHPFSCKKTRIRRPAKNDQKVS
jgi:hypothetical protein